jgi:hypothetical protein
VLAPAPAVKTTVDPPAVRRLPNWSRPRNVSVTAPPDTTIPRDTETTD